MKGTPFKLKQKLSPSAAKKKAARDKASAMTAKRKKHKREAQAERRSAIKKGVNVKGKDYDHYTKSFVPSSKNRAGMNPNSPGTKNE